MFRSVGVIPYFGQKILIQKRDFKKKIYYPGFWGLFSGKVKRRETYKLAAIREFKEETNLHLTNLKRVLKIKINFDFFDKKKRERVYFITKLDIDWKKKFFLKEGKNFKLTYPRYLFNLKFVPIDLFIVLYILYRKKIRF